MTIYNYPINYQPVEYLLLLLPSPFFLPGDCTYQTTTQINVSVNTVTFSSEQGRAETFGGAGAQNIKGAHETRL